MNVVFGYCPFDMGGTIWVCYVVVMFASVFPENYFLFGNGRRPAAYICLSTSGLVGKWLHELYLKLMNHCVH